MANLSPMKFKDVRLKDIDKGHSYYYEPIPFFRNYGILSRAPFL